MHYVRLSCSRFRGRQSAENIAQQVEETLACFDISDKVTTIITDSALDMVAGVTLPGLEEPEDSSSG